MSNQVIIEESSTIYEVNTTYHSDIKCENFDAKIKVTEYKDDKMTIEPQKGNCRAFIFERSDPDRVIAIAQMMLAAAQMVKNHNQKPIDIDEEA